MTYKVVHVVSGLVVNARGEILMGQHPTMGWWETPGGKVDPSDGTIYQALTREFREELDVGIQFPLADPVSTCLVELDVDLVVTLFRVRLFGQPQRREHKELRWILPEVAARTLPCSPGFYGHYRDIKRHIDEFGGDDA